MKYKAYRKEAKERLQEVSEVDTFEISTRDKYEVSQSYDL